MGINKINERVFNFGIFVYIIGLIFIFIPPAGLDGVFFISGTFIVVISFFADSLFKKNK